jgi:hypothetical protein
VSVIPSHGLFFAWAILSPVGFFRWGSKQNWGSTKCYKERNDRRQKIFSLFTTTRDMSALTFDVF